VLPQPRVTLGRVLAEQALAHAGMDISDGLVADLGHMCAASNCGAEVAVASVPLSDAVADLVAGDPSLIAAAITGGDDYELLLAVPPDRVAAVLDAARQAGTAIAEIGTFAQEFGLTFLDRDNLPLAFEKAGFTHF
jgi:thiamine-monophosphate kinase